MSTADLGAKARHEHARLLMDHVARSLYAAEDVERHGVTFESWIGDAGNERRARCVFVELGLRGAIDVADGQPKHRHKYHYGRCQCGAVRTRPLHAAYAAGEGEG